MKRYYRCRLTDVLTDAECARAIEGGKSTMVRSPEKHYSPGYENYRTSTTGYFPRGAAKIAKRLKDLEHQVSRLPSLGYVEDAQLLRYEPGQWHKKHYARRNCGTLLVTKTRKPCSSTAAALGVR